MKSISIFSRTTKFGFAALFGISLTISAHAATKYTTMTDLKGGSDASHSSETSWGNVFGNGGGISNGTLTVKFKKDSWGTFNNLSVTVGEKGLLTADYATSGNKNCQLNIKGGATMTLDGGTFVNNNDRTKTYGNMIATDGSDGTMRIINGGVFKSPNIHVELGAKQGSTGTLSVDNGTVEVGGATGSKWLTVGGTRGEEDASTYGGTGILAMTNATLIAESVVLGSAYKYANTADGDNKYTAKVTFIKDTKITTQRFYSLNKVKSDSFVIFDGATVNTAANSKDLLAALAVDYTLEGSGVTINTKHSGTTVGGSFAGVGPFIKKGAETLTFKGKFTGSADLRVEEGVFAIDSTAALPTADKIDLMISGTGAFMGLDQTATYKSLTLGEDAVLPVAFENGAVTTFKAAETIVTATADHPVTIAGTGVLTANTVVAEGLTVTDASLFVLSGVAGSLKIEDGKLIAVKPSRPVDTLTWAKGSEGDNWSGTDNWTYGDPAAETTFQDGDTAVFAMAGDNAVVDADVTAAKVEFTADATVTGTATLTTTNITVGADVTATIAAPLSEDIEKTGEGELVLQDYADGKALDLKEGKVTLSWTGEKQENPFSTANDANSIAGVLDLGGATQNIKSSLAGKGKGILRNGGVLLNGKLVIDPTDASSSNWWRLENTTFTVGKDATLEIAQATDQDGEIGFIGGACLVIDGGKVNALNKRSTSGTGGYLGDSSGENVIRIVNGGTFYQPNQFLRVGFKASGILSVDNGTVDLKGNDLRIASDTGATGVFAMTNGILKAKAVQFSEVKSCLSTFILKNSVVEIEQIKIGQVPADGSTVLFDGATLVPTVAANLLPNLGIPTTIGANGLIISNNFDVTVAAPLAGEGKLTKKGTGTLTLSGASTFTGGIEVLEGDVVFAKGATLPEGALAVVDGTTVKVNYSADGFAGTPNLTLSVPAEGTVHVEIDAAQIPEGGKAYKLFDKIEGGTVDNLTITDGYGIEIGEDGSVTVKLSPKTHIWDGEGEDNNWGTDENWDTDKCPVVADSIIFNEGGAVTAFDLADGLALANIEVNSGAWTTKVDNACFANVPVQIKSGALFALTGAEKVTNPFSTANKNNIAGILDFGGATQKFTGLGFLDDGGEIKHGKVTLDSDKINTAKFTFSGKDTAVTTGAQLNLGSDSLLVIADGASLTSSYSQNVTDAGGYIGNSGNAVVELRNGALVHNKKRLYIGRGHSAKGNGAVIGTDATIDLGSGNELIMGNRNGSSSLLALTNSTLTCKHIQFGLSGGTPGAQTIVLKDTAVNCGGFDVQTIVKGSTVTFDNTTLKDNGTKIAILPALGDNAYTLAQGGLTFLSSNCDDKHSEVTMAGKIDGEGNLTLAAQGKDPKSVTFSGSVYDFTGNLVVSNKITVTANNKTFKGGLYACKGSTLDVATSIFEGAVTLEDGVKFATEGVAMDATMTSLVTVLKAKGDINLPESGFYDKTTRNGVVLVQRNGYKELRYGRQPGFMILIK